MNTEISSVCFTGPQPEHLYDYKSYKSGSNFIAVSSGKVLTLARMRASERGLNKFTPTLLDTLPPTLKRFPVT